MHDIETLQPVTPSIINEIKEPLPTECYHSCLGCPSQRIASVGNDPHRAVHHSTEAGEAAHSAALAGQALGPESGSGTHTIARHGVLGACHSRTAESKGKRTPEACGLPTQPKNSSSTLSKRLCLKGTRWKVTGQWVPSSGLHARTSAHIPHTHTYKNTNEVKLF